MENANVIDKKDRILIFGLACIFLIAQSFSVVFAGLPPLPDDFKVSEYFSFFGSGGIDWRALHDPDNNPILVACLKGIADESLKPPGTLNIQRRLERLERGNLIKKVDGRYILAFPALVGDKRDRLQEYAEQAARQLVRPAEKMIARIRPHLAGREEMLYHVLWSVVMDGGPAWDTAHTEMNKNIDAGDTSIQNKAWLLYPSHPYRAGTNSSSNSFGHLKVTWSRNTPSPNAVGRVISQYATQLVQAIEQDHAIESADSKDALSKYGLVDEAGNVRFYVIQSDSEAARSYAELGMQFGRQMMTHLDVKKVSEMLEVSPGIAFVIAYHEICWQLLHDLAEKKVLSVPRIVSHAGTKTSEAYRLVSLTTIESVKDPLPDTEINTEEAQAIEEFRRIKARILAGESYADDSTPLRAVLTRFSSWEPEGRGYFMGLDILRAPLPPAKLEEGSLWPVYAGDKELEDTFILVYAKDRWIWLGNIGSNHDWRIARSTFEKWAREKIGQSVPAGDSDNPPVTEAQTPGESTGNRVLSLDGDGDFVRIADSQSLHSFSNAITIEVWVKASSYAEYGDINSIIRKNVASGAENFLLRFRNVDGNLFVQMSLIGIGILAAQHEFAVDQWYHLAGAYDRSAITFLINGVTIESGNFSGPLYIDKSDLFIGRGDPEFRSGEYFHGALDEVRIWNVARSPEEIRAAMNSSLTGKEDGLVVYLNFDGGTAKDLSGHGNDGFLNADAQIVESPFPVSLAPKGEQPDKLVAWWKFEDDSKDSAGDNHGTIHGNPTYVEGKAGRAISLDGDDYVDCGNPDSLNFGTGDWTMSAWIKTTQTGTNQQDDALLNRGTVFANGGDEAGGIRYALAVNEGQLGSITLTTDDDVYKIQAIGKTAVNDGAWHHVVGIRKAGQLHLYIDGVLDGGNYVSAGYDLSGVSQHNAYIGVITDNRDSSLYKYFVGLIDEVCIIRGAIDANGVRMLYSGEDPMTVAKTAIISQVVTKPQARQQPVAGAGPRGGIVGDWQMISDQISSKAVIEIRRESDGALSAIVVAENAADASQAMSMNNVTFENGKLRFEIPSDDGAFEGTMKEDGLTIEGEFQQQGQVMAIVLKRVDPIPSGTAPASQEQLHAQTSNASNIATALILILALSGVVAGIVYFLVKSSIR